MQKTSVMAGVLAAAVLASSLAIAKEYTIEVRPDRRKCYRVEYVPATYRVETRGKLVEGARKVWEGDVREAGAVVVKRKLPAVYIAKRTLIEEDHYTLHPVACR